MELDWGWRLNRNFISCKLPWSTLQSQIVIWQGHLEGSQEGWQMSAQRAVCANELYRPIKWEPLIHDAKRWKRWEHSRVNDEIRRHWWSFRKRYHVYLNWGGSWVEKAYLDLSFLCLTWKHVWGCKWNSIYQSILQSHAHVPWSKVVHHKCYSKQMGSASADWTTDSRT